jgi:chorismate mutase
MRLDKKKLAFLAACSIIFATDRVYPQNTIDKLQHLVETSAQRLAIAEQVALAKWESGMPVDDVPREERVIVSAVRAGESRGLDQTAVSNFFRAQIEANKLVQYSLLAEWRRVGKAPDHPPANLANTIRPELDQLETALIAELAETAGIRANASCRADIAKAVGKYVSERKNRVTALRAIALDRAMAASCTSLR